MRVPDTAQLYFEQKTNWTRNMNNSFSERYTFRSRPPNLADVAISRTRPLYYHLDATKYSIDYPSIIYPQSPYSIKNIAEHPSYLAGIAVVKMGGDASGDLPPRDKWHRLSRRRIAAKPPEC
ncbi:hypothetical protein EVAR_32920_1 [Eumeta japonica]|uniref:Uncharacterized protein n=1 Tax=Eumeta variegata TaxID=151549 RepID=A0A4C1X4D4_EUMVA|nr:hypothetical protein EVAR_32920_1 [Eumeta japonica]